MTEHVLRKPPAHDDDRWEFTVPHHALQPRKPGHGKFISFTKDQIVLRHGALPSNRVLHHDDPSKFVLVSFGELRFPDKSLRVTGDYIARFLISGLYLNGTQYRFYHHSNSQLRGRSCFMRQANTDQELDDRIYAMGNFRDIKNVAKRAKRIGLLFSAADIDYQLDPQRTEDIPDLKSGPTGDELMSDGCGLISRRLLVELSKRKKIVFRSVRYTPSVVQIRYRGYKGVLMLHPPLDAEKRHLAQFRDSMRKFRATQDNTFSVVGHSTPYAFGRLNNDVIVLLNSLGITTEKLVAKQQAYFDWLTDANSDPAKAFDFLAAMDLYPLAERVLLDGIDNPEVNKRLRAIRSQEVTHFRKNDKMRVRMIIHQSRLLFGVCDPFGLLREGEVHVRITAGRRACTTLTNTDLLVVRNPCLHPGDCLKLRAVAHEKLSHLIDCVVFSSVGRRAAPSMMSGGDLDGDKFFVCWDPDLVPTKEFESYGYPPNKERSSTNITREDLVRHFASYNSSGLARVATLHQKWARYSPEGAGSAECQELNALHSQSVDGASIKIPERLQDPPTAEEPYVIDVLVAEASKFAETFEQEDLEDSLRVAPASQSAAQELVVRILQTDHTALSEYEVFNAAFRISRKFDLDMRPLLPHINFSALSNAEKHTLSTAVGLDPETDPYVWNSLLRSDLLPAQAFEIGGLGGPLRMQRLYTSDTAGTAAFFEYLKIGVQDFTRKLIIIKTDNRFALAIFIRGNIVWADDPEEDCEVSENVVVCSFMPHGSKVVSHYRPCTAGYRLHCADGNFQLFEKKKANTFVFMNRPPPKSGQYLATSIALQKISGHVSKQVGRVNKTPVVSVEIHVVSNRDRLGQQLFDLRFQHVQTEEFQRIQTHQRLPYTLNSLHNVDWTAKQPWMRQVLMQSSSTEREHALRSRSNSELDEAAALCVDCHAEEHLYQIFGIMCEQKPLSYRSLLRAMDFFPSLAFSLLRHFPATEENRLLPTLREIDVQIIQHLIRSANDFGIATLVALEKMSATVGALRMEDYIDITMFAAMTIRSTQLVQETLLVLQDCRSLSSEQAKTALYAQQHALAVAFDRAEEAADECPCDDQGRPRKQRVRPVDAKLLFADDGKRAIKADIRIDVPTNIRLHSHIRLKSTSEVEHGWAPIKVMDGVVRQARKGELNIELFHSPPPEMERMSWLLYNAGSVANTQAMMAAIKRLVSGGSESCRFYRQIVGAADVAESLDSDHSDEAEEDPSVRRLNPSQVAAVRSCDLPLSLIWGPPGTGKTTVVVQILRRILLRMLRAESKVLVTASTHNAVDNILERFIELNTEEHLIPEQKLIRVATDYTKVSSSLQSYTVDGRLGGDPNANPRLLEQAKKRVEEALVVFTTCAGAGLGTLRSVDFDIVLIDEASQVTEPCALIPLVKGCRRAVLVGDHVQLRPTVKPMAKALLYDVSLLERLYTSDQRGISRTMLDIQYRFPSQIAAFPSNEFYEGRLHTGMAEARARVLLNELRASQFPWPTSNGVVIPTVFINCAAEEDMGGASKANRGQAELVAKVVQLLRTPTVPGEVAEQRTGNEEAPAALSLSITVLTPYSKQVSMLRGLLTNSASAPAGTIDGFQGRESDIIIFSTVRSNVSGDIGFVEDPRRLNVAWTRARRALIVVGNKETMTNTGGGASGMWKRAIDACTEIRTEGTPLETIS